MKHIPKCMGESDFISGGTPFPLFLCKKCGKHFTLADNMQEKTSPIKEEAKTMKVEHYLVCFGCSRFILQDHVIDGKCKYCGDVPKEFDPCDETMPPYIYHRWK